MNEEEAKVGMAQAFAWCIFGIVLVCNMYGCHRIDSEHYLQVKVKAIEAGLYQDDKGHWKK